MLTDIPQLGKTDQKGEIVSMPVGEPPQLTELRNQVLRSK